MMTVRQPIHILQIVGAPVGGIRKHIHTIINELDKNLFQQSYAFAQQISDKAFRDEYEQITQRVQGIVPLTIVKKPAVNDVMNIIKLAKYVREKRVDIVHGHGAKGGVYARVLRRLTHVKAVYTPHGGSVHQMFSPLAHKIYGMVERQLQAWTDYLIFESKYTADAYQALVGKLTTHWSINYNGIHAVDRIRIAEAAQALGYDHSTDEPLHIGVFGMLRKAKGQVYAIDALADLSHRGYKIKLHFFGEGDDRQFLMQHAQMLGISDQIIFHGEVAPVEPHLYNMDLILIPSLFESFGYVALEALQLGKPVIASNVGGLREIITDDVNGELIPAGQATAISQAVINFINNGRTLKKTATIKDTLDERFTTTYMLAELSKIYNIVIGSN